MAANIYKEVVYAKHKSAEVFNHYADHLEMMDTINTMGNVAQQLFGDIVAKTLSRPVMEF